MGFSFSNFFFFGVGVAIVELEFGFRVKLHYFLFTLFGYRKCSKIEENNYLITILLLFY